MTVYKVVSYKRTVRSKIDSRSHDLVLTDLYETEEMCPRKVKLSIKLYKTLKSLFLLGAFLYMHYDAKQNNYK